MPPTTVGRKSPQNVAAKVLGEKTIPANPAKLDKFLLAQVVWCTFPALLFVRVGQSTLGAMWCLSFLLVFLTGYTLIRNVPAFVALIVATLPALSFTRLFFFYNSIVFLLGLGLAFWVLRSPKECARLWKTPTIRLFFIVGIIYWVISVFITRKYYANLMVVEMLCCAASVYLLARYPGYLATALVGVSLAVFSLTVGLFGLGDRLGMAEIGGYTVGNPYIIGLPAVLVLLLALSDNAKWLLLQNSKFLKHGLIAMSGAILLLTTSRGSWLVALVGVGITVFFQAQHRRKIVVAFILMIFVLLGVLQTERGEKVAEWFELATDSERTWSEKTTGRAEQWQLFLNVFQDSPIWGVGPGLGNEAYAYYSWIDEEITLRKGSNLAWHAIYMHVGVETGIIGLLILMGFLMALIFRSLHYRQATGNVVPLIGILGFMTLGLTMPGIHGLAGLYLGLAFHGTTLSVDKSS